MTSLLLPSEIQFDYNFKISHWDKMFLMGSCFSDNIHSQFLKNGFTAERMGNGTVFHPLALAKFIADCFKEDYDERIVQQQDLFFSMDFSGRVYGLNQTEFAKDLKRIRKETVELLTTSTVVFVTFGTSYGFTYFDGEIVANCHKEPSLRFDKKLFDVEGMNEVWQSAILFLQQINPKLNIVFTVSPVRYLKEGLIENSRSKARLIALCESLSKNDKCHYFPSYELVVDKLRDYQYFEEDGVHPTEKAVEFIWKSLEWSFFGPETMAVLRESEELRKASQHKPLYPESFAAKKFVSETEDKIRLFQIANPAFKW